MCSVNVLSIREYILLMEFYLNSYFILSSLEDAEHRRMQRAQNYVCLELHRVPLKTSTKRVLWRKWHERRRD